jgi:hypothetical protein
MHSYNFVSDEVQQMADAKKLELTLQVLMSFILCIINFIHVQYSIVYIFNFLWYILYEFILKQKTLKYNIPNLIEIFLVILPMKHVDGQAGRLNIPHSFCTVHERNS